MLTNCRNRDKLYYRHTITTWYNNPVYITSNFNRYNIQHVVTEFNEEIPASDVELLFSRQTSFFIQKF